MLPVSMVSAASSLGPFRSGPLEHATSPAAAQAPTKHKREQKADQRTDFDWNTMDLRTMVERTVRLVARAAPAPCIVKHGRHEGATPRISARDHTHRAVPSGPRREFGTRWHNPLSTAFTASARALRAPASSSSDVSRSARRDAPRAHVDVIQWVTQAGNTLAARLAPSSRRSPRAGIGEGGARRGVSERRCSGSASRPRPIERAPSSAQPSSARGGRRARRWRSAPAGPRGSAFATGRLGTSPAERRCARSLGFWRLAPHGRRAWGGAVDFCGWFSAPS